MPAVADAVPIGHNIVDGLAFVIEDPDALCNAVAIFFRDAFRIAHGIDDAVTHCNPHPRELCHPHCVFSCHGVCNVYAFINSGALWLHDTIDEPGTVWVFLWHAIWHCDVSYESNAFCHFYCLDRRFGVCNVYAFINSGALCDSLGDGVFHAVY